MNHCKLNFHLKMSRVLVLYLADAVRQLSDASVHLVSRDHDADLGTRARAWTHTRKHFDDVEIIVLREVVRQRRHSPLEKNKSINAVGSSEIMLGSIEFLIEI